MGASYHSVETEIVEDDNGAVHLSNASLSIGTRGIELYKSGENIFSLQVALRNVFPLSQKSQNEGYRSVPSVTATSIYQRGMMSFLLTAQRTHVVNTYDTNLTGAPNLESSLTGGLGLLLSFKNFNFQYSYRSGILKYTDNSNIGNSGNSFRILTAITKNTWASLETSNVNYIEDQFVDLWFYDHFTRIYNLNIGVTF